MEASVFRPPERKLLARLDIMRFICIIYMNKTNAF